jgi:putative pyruvate formate lyase activating enzyme
VVVMVAHRLVDERADIAASQYDCCHLCEHHCGINRALELGRCHAGVVPRVFRNRVECGEEEIISPSHLFYLSGCDFRCVFCISELNAFDPARGHELTAEFFSNTLQRGIARGARTLEWVGGEPTIHLPAILRVMSQFEHLPPVVWKSNFHFSAEALALLDGIVDFYIADYKFGNDACAKRLAGIPQYIAILQRNLLAAAHQGRLIVRHLLMPGHFSCCWLPAAQWLADHLPRAEISIRDGFLPRWRSGRFPELACPLDRTTLARAHETSRRLGLKVIA